MTLECLGSSSSGNCYLLNANNSTLVVECGIPMYEVKKALGWKIGRIAGCIVSHKHDDHAEYISEYLKSGIRVMALKEVFEAKNLSDNVFACPIKPQRGYTVADFNVYTLPVLHDVPCLGFVIEHAEMGKLLFVTDTVSLKYRVRELNHIMIEANYSDEALEDAIKRGATSPMMRERLLRSHMELETTARILESTDLTDVSEVVLLHLSSNNADISQFKTRIMQSCSRPVYIAGNGLKIDISKGGY